MTTTTEGATSAQHAMFWQRTRRVAFLSVVVGVALELVLLGIVALGSHAPDAARAIAQIAGKVSWSFVVCVGLSFGLAASNGRAQIMGILGAVSGPAGLAVAKSVHKGTLQVLADGPIAATPDVLSPLLLAGIKVVEYGVFGLWLGSISRTEGARLGRYLRAGLTIGVVFGGLFLLLYTRAKPEATWIELVSKGINEMAFPLGCSTVLFVTKKTAAVVRAS